MPKSHPFSLILFFIFKFPRKPSFLLIFVNILVKFGISTFMYNISKIIDKLAYDEKNMTKLCLISLVILSTEELTEWTALHPSGR